jgi:predicted nucleic acid-binding protein
MPLPATKFAVLDTSIYIENFRTGRFTFRILQSSLIPRCSVVVLHELLRGARRDLEWRFVQELRTRCHLLVPTAEHWIKAAEVLAAIRKQRHFDANKIRELAFDGLIALSARSIGAVLITSNESDFQTIRRYVPVQVQYWA